MALRLAFRQPEGITRLNGTRLNSLIRENKRSLDLEQVASILKKWRIEEWVERNLIELHRRHRIRILYDHRMVPGIEDKILSRSQKKWTDGPLRLVRSSYGKSI